VQEPLKNIYNTLSNAFLVKDKKTFYYIKTYIYFVQNSSVIFRGVNKTKFEIVY